VTTMPPTPSTSSAVSEAKPPAPEEKAPSRWIPVWRFTVSVLRMPSGLIGVLVLVAFIGVALLAPLFIHPSDLSVTQATGPLLAPPQKGYPLGTDQAGRGPWVSSSTSARRRPA
jgi:ABC-type dipeptide/oligopeptide/nickel transport system permease subunit